jgi:hypothetical protein
MRLSNAAAFVIALLLSAQTLSQPSPEDIQRFDQGIIAINNSMKNEAWSLLLPLAKKGNPLAAYKLGEMVMNSPEFPNHIQKAEKLFAAASSMGYTPAIEMLRSLNQFQKDQAAQAQILAQTVTARSIDSKSINILRESAEAEFYKIAIENGLIAEKTELDVTVFLNKVDAEAAQIAKQLSALVKDNGERVKVDYVLIFEDLVNDPFGGRDNPYKMPEEGVTPDFKGVMAKEWGVTSFPSIFTTKDGERNFEKSLNNAKRKIREVQNRR